jgi:hypothetical protein
VKPPVFSEESMMRKLFVAMTVLVCSFSLLAAEEFRAVIKKVDGNKVTLVKAKRGEKAGEPVTLTATSTVKVAKSKFDRTAKKVEVGEAVENGLKNELFTKGDVNARVTTNDAGEITQILVGGRGGDGKRKKKDE